MSVPSDWEPPTGWRILECKSGYSWQHEASGKVVAIGDTAAVLAVESALEIQQNTAKRPSLGWWSEIPEAHAWALAFMHGGGRFDGWGVWSSLTDPDGYYGSPRVETVWSRGMKWHGHDVEWRLRAETAGSLDVPRSKWPTKWSFALAWPGLDVGELPEDEV